MGNASSVGQIVGCWRLFAQENGNDEIDPCIKLGCPLIGGRRFDICTYDQITRGDDEAMSSHVACSDDEKPKMCGDDEGAHVFNGIAFHDEEGRHDG